MGDLNVILILKGVKIMSVEHHELAEAYLRKLVEEGNVIMEGRDITTVVFPNAEVKIYLDAKLEIRAERRYKELVERGNNVTYEDTLESIRKRDKNDMEKEMGALKIAEDAVVIDTSNMTIEEVYDKIKEIIELKK